MLRPSNSRHWVLASCRNLSKYRKCKFFPQQLKRSTNICGESQSCCKLNMQSFRVNIDEQFSVESSLDLGTQWTVSRPNKSQDNGLARERHKLRKAELVLKSNRRIQGWKTLSRVDFWNWTLTICSFLLSYGRSKVEDEISNAFWQSKDQI